MYGSCILHLSSICLKDEECHIYYCEQHNNLKDAFLKANLFFFYIRAQHLQRIFFLN